MTSIDVRLRRVQRRSCASAGWCEQLALFAVPYLAIVVFGHRVGLIETPSSFWLLGLAFVLLVAALGFGIRGFYELWVYGNIGGMRSLRGVTLALILLLPFAYFGQKALALPQLHDVSTDLVSPPDFDTALYDRAVGMNPLGEMDIARRDQQISAYPQISARRYPLGSGRIFVEIIALARDRDWEILASETEQGQAPIDEQGSGLVAEPDRDGQGLARRPILPKFRPDEEQTDANRSEAPSTVTISPLGREEAEDAEGGDERYVEAVAASFLMGFESDVVIRLIEEEEGTLVDMRAASRWGPHDLGANAELITSFLADLDTSLQGQSAGN